jgi:hypothetical protein
MQMNLIRQGAVEGGERASIILNTKYESTRRLEVSAFKISCLWAWLIGML